MTLSSNLKFAGTVNIGETTHGFADKVYDRAQLSAVAGAVPPRVDELRARPTDPTARLACDPPYRAVFQSWLALDRR